jgi:RNA polymerase sigma factor (sigma-70 family)
MSKSGQELRRERLEAFETVVSEYEGALIRYAARILGNSDAAQDVVQDAFLQLLRRWEDDLKPSPMLTSWLYRVTHNRAVDYLRKQSRRDLLHKQHAEEHPDFVQPNRGAGFQLSEAAARAAAALQRLSVRERQLVVLKVYEEKSYRQISEISGLTVGNVGYILHHAMRKLAGALKGEAEVADVPDRAHPRVAAASAAAGPETREEDRWPAPDQPESER